ncbi:RNA polymerase sigma-70 factor (sigma-E family) [Kibdelosporangium banguiense]|uniref:RNA polymerase sigma-70 factor (Sigma-E family) n=1 Tax=Kibdelosporangium banguiense TaxID=1365924 RepID=A0ABS4TZ62_9PSEU|nr:SigE family RNA polymerase sigma factor [Kibdelosporangium banguiense]MBP2329699.1 RNA polymerase sigma-70 factor (sigma-E family) [Kibdelosporangium banguiense]
MHADLEREYVEYVQARLTDLRRAAYRLCGDPHSGDDLVQQAITKLYVNWRRARVVANMDAYVHRILVNVFLDERRLRWSRVSLFSSAPEVAGPVDSQADDRATLRAALGHLPRRLRAVLVLRFLLDFSIEDTARALGCSSGTVKSQTSRGLAEMRRLLPAQLKEA